MRFFASYNFIRTFDIGDHIAKKHQTRIDSKNRIFQIWLKKTYSLIRVESLLTIITMIWLKNHLLWFDSKNHRLGFDSKLWFAVFWVEKLLTGFDSKNDRRRFDSKNWLKILIKFQSARNLFFSKLTWVENLIITSFRS